MEPENVYEAGSSEAQPTCGAQLLPTFDATIPTLKWASHQIKSTLKAPIISPFASARTPNDESSPSHTSCSTHNQRFNPNFWPTQFKARLTDKQAGKPDNSLSISQIYQPKKYPSMAESPLLSLACTESRDEQCDGREQLCKHVGSQLCSYDVLVEQPVL